MNKTFPLSVFALATLLAITPPAEAQTAAPTSATAVADAAREAIVKAQQAAQLATEKIRAATPVLTIPGVIGTAPPVASAAPKATAPAPGGSVKPGAIPAPASLPTHAETQAIALDLDALRKSRPDRRHAEVLDLQARWGNLLSAPLATAELKQHAQRIAYLERVRALGSQADDVGFVQSVDALLATEETRDTNAMTVLRGGAAPVAGGAQ